MGIFDDLKSAANVLQEAGKLKELQQLLNAQKELLEMQNMIKTQAEEIEILKEKLKIKGDIFFESNAYWLKKENDSKEGPFCSGCWDNQNKQLVYLHLRDDVRNGWTCPVCKVFVRIHTNPTKSDPGPTIVTRDEETW